MTQNSFVLTNARISTRSTVVIDEPAASPIALTAVMPRCSKSRTPFASVDIVDTGSHINVRAKLPAQACVAWPRKDNRPPAPKRPSSVCRSGSD